MTFKMRTWRGRIIKALAWTLLKLHCISENAYFNAVLTARVLEEGLRVKEVPVGGSRYDQ